MLLDYQKAVAWLYQRNLFSTGKYDLSMMFRLRNLFGGPDRSFPMIHVTGTNGKGSVCTKIAKALEEVPLRVGLFTSPHLFCFRERLQICGEMISEEDVVHLVNHIQQTLEEEKLNPSFFEVLFLMALLYFKQKKVDVAVIEVGLGGRLDATNIITPVLSVITGISLDHTHVLGDSLEKISFEKAGIIKEGIPCVLGRSACRSDLIEAAYQKQAPVLLSMQEDLYSELENRSTARCALRYLQKLFPLTEKNIEVGLNKTPPCRFQICEDISGKTVILDVAHNVAGFATLKVRLAHLFPSRPVFFVLGFSHGKDGQGCFNEIVDVGEYFAIVPNPLRPYDVGSLSLPKKAHLFSCIEDGVQDALNRVVDNGIVVICGSFFIMPRVAQTLGLNVVMDSHEMNERDVVKVS